MSSLELAWSPTFSTGVRIFDGPYPMSHFAVDRVRSMERSIRRKRFREVSASVFNHHCSIALSIVFASAFACSSRESGSDRVPGDGEHSTAGDVDAGTE